MSQTCLVSHGLRHGYSLRLKTMARAKVKIPVSANSNTYHAYKAYNGDHGMSGAGMVYRHVLTCDRKGLYGSSQRRLPRWIISGPESLR
jgi:imidazole glycerol phosphate synthase subunit HisF